MLCCVAGLTAAEADVLRFATVVSDGQTSFANNIAPGPALVAIMKKGHGFKSVNTGTDPAKMTYVSVSVWANETDIASVTNSEEWKAEVAKLKKATVGIEVF